MGLILGVSGLAGSGKSLVAEYIAHNFNGVQCALADPIKRIVAEVYRFSETQLWGPSEMRNAPDERYPRWVADVHGEKVQQYLSPRYALQQLGTEWARDCYQNTWVDHTLRIASEVLSTTPPYKTYDRRLGVIPWNAPAPHQVVVISDVRFQNEIEAVRHAGGKLIRLVRPGAGLSGAAAAHPSEKEQSEIPDEAFDDVIMNDRSKEELFLRLNFLVNLWMR